VLEHENRGLRQAIIMQKRKNKKGIRLNLYGEESQGTEYYSLIKVVRAREYYQEKQAQEAQEEAEKLQRKADREANAANNRALKEERARKAQELKEEREAKKVEAQLAKELRASTSIARTLNSTAKKPEKSASNDIPVPKKPS
jgi:flagellar biosynthesis GTPase FlhF